LLIVQHLIGGPHPVLPQIADFFNNEAVGEAPLGTVSGSHGITLLAFRVEESGRNRTWFNSQMASMASFSFW
jgi:hypothetical protein